MDDDNEILESSGIPPTIIGSSEWIQLEKMEKTIGEDALLEQILSAKLWSNVEIIWVLKKMIFYYGRKDALLKKTPLDRLFMNMSDVLRCFFLIFDALDPELDDNMRSYVSGKLADATFGVSERTRRYLEKIE
ncbi:MAG: hypothetical protein LBR98_08835 [Syntrophomonadaceae bacterium]|jgi:hypothetical protein|nr:hypothetical protein [Syntrophomonadaceae bacterium]